MTLRPDLPAAARLMEAARSLRLEARALRMLSPSRTAMSQSAEVTAGPDGRLLSMVLLDPPVLPASQWGAHLTALYRAATGAEVDGVIVADVDESSLPPMAKGLGPGRFSFPPGIDGDAPPEIVLGQVNQRLRSRFAAAESASARIAELQASGTGGDEREVSLRIGSLGNLIDLQVSSRLATVPVEAANAALASAIEAAAADLRGQIDELLDKEGL